MYFNLVGPLRRRLILELQDSFSDHPIYRKIVPTIQNKFSFEQRPQFGIVVKGSGGNKVQLSGDNYMGQVRSRVMLAYVGKPEFPIEWVREDQRVVATTGGMPTAPGIYFIEILKAPTHAEDVGEFTVSPLLTVTNEPLLLFRSGLEREGQLELTPAPGTLRLYQNGRYLLKEGIHYTLGESGQVTFLREFAPGARVSADYRHTAPDAGPFPFTWNSANVTALPGVILAFGKRSEAGQKVSVVVYQDLVQAAEAYGGKFEATFDLDVVARDNTQMEEIADLVFMYLWSQKKSILELEGIEIMDVSFGSESEEPVDETGDDYIFTSSMSVQIRADWELHVPMPLTISRVTPLSGEGPDAKNMIQAVTSEMFFKSHPILFGRNQNYERIG